MSTALSPGFEVGDKKIKSSDEVLCCSVRQALYYLAVYLNAALHFHKIRSL